jgi:hypothetical protein
MGLLGGPSRSLWLESLQLSRFFFSPVSFVNFVPWPFNADIAKVLTLNEARRIARTSQNCQTYMAATSTKKEARSA